MRTKYGLHLYLCTCTNLRGLYVVICIVPGMLKVSFVVITIVIIIVSAKLGKYIYIYI